MLNDTFAGGDGKQKPPKEKDKNKDKKLGR